MDKIDLSEKLSLINEHWKPKIVGELNGQYVKLVKFKGPFTWHHHDNEDEMFLVVKGRFRMEFREPHRDSTVTATRSDSEQDATTREVWLEEGEFIIVPRGVEHCPVADEEAHVLLFEPVSTLNTGNVEDDFTVKDLERI
jgi:mannose-6-phosphate isomerase-like protein (cupin superfamily)